MATQTYTNGVTLTDATEFNNFDSVAYSVLSGVAGTNTITATGPANYTLSATRPPVWLIPAASNTGATTIAITPSGGAALTTKNIFCDGAACVGGELIVGVPTAIVYDGTQFNIVGSGSRRGLVQRAYQEYTSNADLATAIPVDDTIPQNTEGVEIMTQAITPKSANSRIRVRFQAFGDNDTTGGALVVALFVDTTADALASSLCIGETAGRPKQVVLEYEESAASTTARTYKIRVGGNTGQTVRLNGTTSARLLGGVARATLIVEEVG